MEDLFLVGEEVVEEVLFLHQLTFQLLEEVEVVVGFLLVLVERSFLEEEVEESLVVIMGFLS